MDEAESKLRSIVCHAAHQMWTRRLIAGAGGLVSAEWGRRRYLVTPTGVRRAHLESARLLCVDVGGHTDLGGDRLDAVSWQPHRCAYQSNRSQGVHATAMATPPSIMSMLRLLPQATELELVGYPPVAVVQADDDDAIKQAIAAEGSSGAVALRDVGLLVASDGCAQALNLLEDLEHAATIDLCTRARD